MRIIVLLLVLALTTARLPAQIEEELVNVRDLIPDIVFDLRYAGPGNFFQTKLYTTNECYLALPVVRRLAIVQDSLRSLGLGIKIFDGYRPRAVQYLLWEILPDSRYVANPASGSSHNRGGAVDLSLVHLDSGVELEMPTEFDFFGPEAGHDYMNLPANVIANRELLKTMMEQVGGLTSYVAEWWHYSYQPAGSYPLLDFQMK